MLRDSVYINRELFINQKEQIMKKTNLLLAVILLTVGTIFAQHKELIKGKSFDRVKLDGNIRLYLEQASEAEVSIEAKKEKYLDDYHIEVRNEILYIRYRDNGFNSTPKIKVYVKHPELKGIDADGLVYVNSMDPITGESFAIKGDGFIRGTVEVDVENLKVDLDGFCFMNFEGKADKSHLRLDGLGRINARNLETYDVDKSADGLAGIRTQ